MCGIAGIVVRGGGAAAAPDVRAMCDAMTHRGPDDAGFVTNEDAAIGMRRLSIIDLATGQQPVANEDGTVWVVLNGEIYNFKELRIELEGRGHRFRTTGDTETIVHLYEERGPDLVDSLRGMFALAVWDQRKRCLLLARDRLGIKPLYFLHRGDRLLFASELKALLQVPGVDRRLHGPAVGHVFAFLSSPSSQSIVEGIRKLEPAHWATWSLTGDLRIERYWDVTFDARRSDPKNPAPRSARHAPNSEDALAERLRTLLAESVALHLRSDVPLGLFLSGGLDSSTVLATMSQLGCGPVKTFSVGFAERGYDELSYARQVAARFGADHHEIVVDPQPADVVEDLTWYLDEPFGDSSAIPTYLVSRLAASHVKVVLSGDGGDEIFAGYDKYVVEGRERIRDRVPAPLRRALGRVAGRMPDGATGRRFLSHIALDGAARYLDAMMLFRPDEQRRLFQGDVAGWIAGGNPSEWAPGSTGALDRGIASDRWLSAVQNHDLHRYLPLDILTKVDRMTMAHSIEARPALLDHRLVEFAATVPSTLRLRRGTTKYLLKRAMRGVLPDRIVNRPKQGFAVPLATWFRSDWMTFVRDILLSDTCRDRGIFSRPYIEHLLHLHEAGRNMDPQLWTLLSFEVWCRLFLDRPARSARPAA